MFEARLSPKLTLRQGPLPHLPFWLLVTFPSAHRVTHGSRTPVRRSVLGLGQLRGARFLKETR